MDRDIPNYNPLVNNKIQHKNLQLHYQRLNNIKVQLSTNIVIPLLKRISFGLSQYQP